MKKYELTMFGERAKELAAFLGLEKSGDESDLNTKLWFEYQSIEGHPKIIISFEV